MCCIIMAERWKREVVSRHVSLQVRNTQKRKVRSGDTSARDGSLEGMKCPHESYFGNQYSWLHCRPDDDTLPTVAQPHTGTLVTPTYQARSSTFLGRVYGVIDVLLQTCSWPRTICIARPDFSCSATILVWLQIHPTIPSSLHRTYEEAPLPSYCNKLFT